MRGPLKVFCVCVGTRYHPIEVVRLAAMFTKHLRLPFQFYCATDQPHLVPGVSQFDGMRVEIEPLVPRADCWGWWQLIEAYRNPSWSGGWQVMYAGLDTVITGDITDVIAERINANRLTLLRDFSDYLPADHESPFRGSYADGIAFIPRGGVPAVWEAFQEVTPEMRLSQYPMHLWMTDALKRCNVVPDFWQDVAPGFVCSYKWPSVKKRQPPEPVVCFHGEPRPEQAVEESPWIKDHWVEGSLI